MTDKQRKIMIGALLYHIDKVDLSKCDEMIIRAADNIAVAADHRKIYDENNSVLKNTQRTPLGSIFNRMNRKENDIGRAIYQPAVLSPDAGIHYPVDKKTFFDVSAYQQIQKRLSDSLMDWKNSEQDINALLKILEENLSYISASSNNEQTDVSLFDYAKMTATLAICLDTYFEEENSENNLNNIFSDVAFYDKALFLLFSMDMSGIQDFIYHQYENKNVLKNLRSRSFYLEIMLENAIDDLLAQLGLSRGNLIYSGGGHAYMLLPNTNRIKSAINVFEKSMNSWIRNEFQADLYLACGYASCSANDLKNEPNGSYSDMFRRVSNVLSDKKLHRYTAEDIINMNDGTSDQQGRECRICHRSDHLTSENLCEICSGLIAMSNGVLNDKVFTVVSEKQTGTELPLGAGRYLITDKRQQNYSKVVRTYLKNAGRGNASAPRMWVGDYCSAPTLEELVKNGTGFSRLGVLRADVDNLGQSFVKGFPADYQTLSRSATFSRKMSLFFKLYINDILKHGEYTIDGGTPKRNAAIIYSGGDDIFLVGAWKDVLEFAVDLYYDLKKFSQGTLTFSCGFAIYDPKYPISYMASQTGELEDFSKERKGKDEFDIKNAITLFDENHRYVWPEFIDKVLGEKFRVIYDYFEGERKLKKGSDDQKQSDERGKAFLYHILDLFRHRDKKINLARLAYTLSRLEPDKKADDTRKTAYQRFSKKMYEWLKNDEDSRQAITAIYLYIYLIRKSDNEEV